MAPRTPKTKLKNIAKRVSAGSTIHDAAIAEGVKPNTVYRHTKTGARGVLKQFIEEQTQRLIEVVPDAVDLIKETIEDSKNSPVGYFATGPDPKERDANIRLRKIAIDASETILKTAQIAPCTSQSVQVNALIVGTRDSLSPVVAKLLGLPEYREDVVDINPIVDPIFQEEVYMSEGDINAVKEREVQENDIVEHSGNDEGVRNVGDDRKDETEIKKEGDADSVGSGI